MNKFHENKTKAIKYVNCILRLVIKKQEVKSILNIGDCKNILIIDFDAIGDIVMHIPFLTVLRRSAPDAKISLVCRPHAKEILEQQGLVDTFYYCERRWFSSLKTLFTDGRQAIKLLLKVRHVKYDLALEPRGDLRDIFFMHFCKSDRKVSYTYSGGEYMLTDPIDPDPEIEHLIDDKMFFLRRLGCDFSDEDKVPKIILSDQDVRDNEEYRISNFLVGKFVIGIHPGSSKEIKKWRKFPELILRLNNSIGNVAFLLFSEKEEGDIVPVIDCVKHHGIHYRHICGDIPEYIRRMALCDVVVCNDSSAAHIAAALGINVHVIFGPVLSELARPFSTASVSVYEPEGIECRPCAQGNCPNGNKCLEVISVDEVFKGVMREIT